MSETECLARDWTFEVDSNGGSAFTIIGGIDTFTLGSSDVQTERHGFSDNGIPRHFVAERGNTLTLNGRYLLDQVTGARDAGQAEATILAGLIGLLSVGSFRVTPPGGANPKTFAGTCKLADIGGDKNAITSWGLEITVSGAIA